jgi:hypothetical protein
MYSSDSALVENIQKLLDDQLKTELDIEYDLDDDDINGIISLIAHLTVHEIYAWRSRRVKRLSVDTKLIM